MSAEWDLDIDLSGLRGISFPKKKQIADKFNQLFGGVGAAVIHNHGVSTTLINDMRSAFTAFFGSDSEYKQQYSRPKTRVTARGYSCMEDLKESAKGMERFSFGDFDVDRADPYYGSDQGRIWFPENFMPGVPEDLTDLANEYFYEMKDLSNRLFEIFEISLSAPSGYFVDNIKKSTGNLTGILYPGVKGPAPSSLRVQPHTDSGILTILNAEPTIEESLQFTDVSGSWVSVKPDVNGYVLNVGDLLHRWSNGKWLSTIHRVLMPSESYRSIPRLSVAFFEHPDYDADIVSYAPDGTEEKFSPVNAGDFESQKRLEIHLMSEEDRLKMLHKQFDDRVQ